MPTSLYMTDVQVEIAFNAGYSTPDGSRTWTDVSAYVELHEGITITFGRGDELSTAEANSCSLTLDNSDGRFTPGLASGAYYPNVKIGRPIRVTSTPVGGSASVRFLGYIEEWPVDWSQGTDNYAATRIAAYSRMARMGLSAPLGNVVYEEYKRDSPVVHFMLDGRGDAVGNSLSLAQTGSGTAVAFTGTGPGTDGISAATFAGGKYLQADVATTHDATLECFFLRSSAPSSAETLVAVGSRVASPDDFIGLTMLSTGQIRASETTGSHTITSTNSYADGATHHVALTWTPSTGPGSTWTLYVDGVSVGTSGPSASLTQYHYLVIGGGATALGGGTFTGTLAHATFTQSVLAAARIAEHATAGSTGFQPEDADDRLARYAAYAEIATAETSFDTDAVTPMAHIDTTGKGALELMRTVEQTDGGVLYDARDNVTTYAARGDRYAAATALSLAAHWWDAPSPKLDRFGLANDVTATVTGTDTSVRAYDQDSIDTYGVAGAQIELTTTSEDEAHGAAWWRVNSYSEPAARISSLGLDLLPLTLAEQTAALGLTVGSKVEQTGLPAQAAASAARYFVEGYTEVIGMESHRFDFNVSPASIAESVLILDDATRGQLDQEVLGY